MTRDPFIIDTHAHLGPARQMLFGTADAQAMLVQMDRLAIRLTIASDHTALLEGRGSGLERMQAAFDESSGRIRALAVFNPQASALCLKEIEAALGWPGLAGIKIHPSFHGTPADDAAYEPAWKLASDAGLPILAHTWSTSDHNPSQVLSLPSRFETWIRQYGSVRLILGHAGGRGDGRAQAIHLASTYPNVYLDFAGDIFCYRLVEQLVRSVPPDRVLFGSDYPWIGPTDHLSRVLLSPITDEQKARILFANAIDLFRLDGVHAQH